MEALYEWVTRNGCSGRRWCPFLGIITLVCLACLQAPPVHGAGYQTTNFTVDAPTPQMARQIGVAAEYYRREMAQQWLGKELLPWSQKCPIKAHVSPQLGAGGATSFIFDQGAVFGWRMEIQGSLQRILDSVLPHEVTHTIFASHFRLPLPRWADEGACTTVEHQSEVSKQEHLLIEFLQTRRGIPFDTMFDMKEYPQDVLPLYAQGHSLAKFLIAQRGKRAFVTFLGDGLQDGAWPRAIHQAYGYRNLLSLQNDWMHWIRQGRPEIQSLKETTLIASRDSRPTLRGQDPGNKPWANTNPRWSSNTINPPTKANTLSAQALNRVTQPWTGVEKTKNRSNSQFTSDITWPATDSHPAFQRAPDKTFSMSRPRTSIYDAARQRGTLYR